MSVSQMQPPHASAAPALQPMLQPAHESGAVCCALSGCWLLMPWLMMHSAQRTAGTGTTSQLYHA
eukprot:COSAG01_NODE_5869_length_3981_cov_1.845183_2_plen_65_part_00